MSKELSVAELAQSLVVSKRDSYLLKKEGVARFLSRKANAMRTESNTKFSIYVDYEGKAATSPARYNNGINKKIAALFGKTKDEMNEMELQAVTVIDQDIADAHERGVEMKLTREQIRKNAHRLCELGFERYVEKMELLGVMK